MILADKDIREHIDGVVGWKNRPEHAFDVRLAHYAHQLEKENQRLRATISGREFDARTGMHDGAPVWIRKLAADMREGARALFARNAGDDADMLEAIAGRFEEKHV